MAIPRMKHGKRIPVRSAFVTVIVLQIWLGISPAASPPVPLTTILEPQAERFGNDLAMGPDILAAGTTSPNGAESGPEFIFDKGVAPGWGLRTTIPVPTGSPASFGTAIAHNGGDLLALGARTDVRLYQRNLGGADTWGILATVPKAAGNSSIYGVAFSGDQLATLETDSTGTNRIYLHLRNNPSANSWSTFVTLTNPLPPSGAPAFAGSAAMEEGFAGGVREGYGGDGRGGVSCLPAKSGWGGFLGACGHVASGGCGGHHAVWKSNAERRAAGLRDDAGGGA